MPSSECRWIAMHWRTSDRRTLPISPSAESAASRRINECHRGRPASHLIIPTAQHVTKAQATHRRGPRLWANRRLRRFRSGAVEKMTGDHRRNTDPMLSSLRSGAKTRSGKPCGVSGGKRRKALPNAWWCAGIRGSPRQQVRAEARPLYARSHRGTPAIAGADAAIAQAGPQTVLPVS
jgi:hypothetical protein